MVRGTLPGIVRSPAALEEDFLSPGFPGRGPHLERLRDGLLPVRERRAPVHLWLHGPPGSGKTSAIKRVLGELEEKSVRTCYVNCWSSQTFYAVLETVFQELRVLVGEQRDVAFKYERLTRLAREHPLVIALDEMDQMFLKERNATLYNLARLDTAGLACLGQSRQAYLSLDSRVQSRLRPLFVEFKPYSIAELVDILHDRASQALEPAGWCRADVEKIAVSAGGDARIAVQTLRIAAYLAEKANALQLRAQDIQDGLRESSQLRRVYLLKGLSEHHRLLYELVSRRPGISTVELWLAYKEEAGKRSMEPMARRTFNHYKQYLLYARLLEERQAKGRRNAKVLRVVE